MADEQNRRYASECVGYCAGASSTDAISLLVTFGRSTEMFVKNLLAAHFVYFCGGAYLLGKRDRYHCPEYTYIQHGNCSAY